MEARLIREWLWTLLEQEHAALNHGDRAVLIDDFVEKLDLARVRPALAGAARERLAAHMQPLARPDWQLPPDLFDAALLEDGRMHEKRLAIHPERERGGVPPRGDEAASRRPRGLLVGMERLGIELAGECEDLVHRNVDATVLGHFAERKVFEIERLRHRLSIRKAEMQDVAVGDHIVLAFEAELARLARAGLAAIGDIIVIGDGFGADKAFFEIGVDDAGRLRRPGSLFDRPRARLLWPRGEEGDKVQERVTGANDAAETGFAQPDRLELSILFGQGQERDLALYFR